jgi:adenylate cyclase
VARREEPCASTFLFADIAGYTALTEAHGDEEAADLARDFCGAVANLVAPDDGELVKTIGDAVMVRYSSPAEAVGLGLRIADDVMAGHGFPTVRVGLHHGPALEREGDWFGATVNLAARVAGLAGGGEVLVTRPVLEAAGEIEGVTFESRGENVVRNVTAPVAVFAAIREDRSAGERYVDPVCRMVVAEGREAGRFRHHETEYRFCSQECIRRFLDAPDVTGRPRHALVTTRP